MRCATCTSCDVESHKLNLMLADAAVASARRSECSTPPWLIRLGPAGLAVLEHSSMPMDPSTTELVVTPSTDAKTIYLIRHAESESNAARNAGTTTAYLIEDALLSATGEAQAAAISEAPAFVGRPPPQLLLVSPLRVLGRPPHHRLKDAPHAHG